MKSCDMSLERRWRMSSSVCMQVQCFGVVDLQLHRCAYPLAIDMHRVGEAFLAAAKGQSCSGKSTLHLRCTAAIPPPDPRALNPTLQYYGTHKLQACRPAAARQETD